mmetsp:Transcript_37055/g.47884  ORF Transcript_37055/g.47884 Transcript_37055/m.47884 type:complete len:205 (+) Transcript_37055:586-1200(+)
MLLDLGADTTLENMDGFTALKLALNGNYGDIADAIDPLGQSIEFERGTAFVGVKDPRRSSKVNLSLRFQEQSYEKVVKLNPALGVFEEDEVEVEDSTPQRNRRHLKSKQRNNNSKDKVHLREDTSTDKPNTPPLQPPLHQKKRNKKKKPEVKVLPHTSSQFTLHHHHHRRGTSSKQPDSYPTGSTKGKASQKTLHHTASQFNLI